jgi:two-component system, NarL family, invasion response regulator UvrY
VTAVERCGPEKPVRVLAVDDQRTFRDVERAVIEATAGFRLVADASSGEAALAAVGDLEPDLVLMDVRMAGIDGIEAARRIARDHPGVVVVLISAEDLRATAAGAGAAAVVRKQDLCPALLRELWVAHGGRRRA